MNQYFKFRILEWLLIIVVVFFIAGEIRGSSLLDFFPKSSGEYNIKTGTDATIGVELGGFFGKDVGSVKVIKLNKHNLILTGKIDAALVVASVKGDLNVELSSTDGTNWHLTCTARNLVDGDGKSIPPYDFKSFPATSSQIGEELSFDIPDLLRYFPKLGKIKLVRQEASLFGGKALIYFKTDHGTAYLYNSKYNEIKRKPNTQ